MLKYRQTRILGLLFLGLASLHGNQAEPPPGPLTLICFGDSLTAGYGLDRREAYPALLEAKAEALSPGWTVVNAGLSGETTAGGRRRVDWVMRRPADIFLLALGANDMLRSVDPEETRQNLQAILDAVRQRQPDALLVLAGMRATPNLGPEYGARFEAVFPEVAATTGAVLIPFLLEGVAGDPHLNQPDGMHPNADGQALMADHLWKTLRPLMQTVGHASGRSPP